MKIETVQRAGAKYAHIEDLNRRREDLQEEWNRLVALHHSGGLPPGGTIPVKIAVGDKFEAASSHYLRAVTVPMTEHVYALILKDVDLEIEHQEGLLAEMGVEL